jgi:hypothetical protein
LEAIPRARAAAAIFAFIVLSGIASAQANDPLVKALYDKIFIYRNEPGTAFRPEFGVTNEELHIDRQGRVTAITRYVTPGSEQQRRGYFAGQADAWAAGQLTGSRFRLRAIKDPDYEMPALHFEAAPDGMTIKRGDGAIYTRQ